MLEGDEQEQVSSREKEIGPERKVEEKQQILWHFFFGHLLI